LFDGTFDGFLSVVYAVYYEKIEPSTLQIQGNEQLSLGVEPLFVQTNEEHAARVFKSFRRKVGEEAASYIYHAFLAADDDRFMAMLKYMQLGFKIGHMVDSHLQENFVLKVHKCSRYVEREAHLLYGFCRFVETKQNVFYCKVTPKHDILELLARHFSQRLMNQAWVIHDKTRTKAAIYDGNMYLITDVPKDNPVQFEEIDEEQQIQGLWITFFNNLAIQARKNPKLQRQLLPLYFRKNMTEFV
jgi:probable DNA metabolism protein